jgi:hypothetical protein
MSIGRRLLRAAARIFFVRRKILFESGLDEPEPAQAGIPLLFRYGGEDDLSALTAPEFGYTREAREFGMERLYAGDRFVLAESEGDVVFYAWVMFRQMDLSCRNYTPLEPRQAYTYKLYTVPSRRGRRICPAYYSFLKRELRTMGYESVLAWVEAGNRPSIQAHTRAGFRKAGVIWHFTVLGRQWFIRPRTKKAARDLRQKAIGCDY